MTVVRISNLYQACYRCILPGKTAQTFHREAANSCSPKLDSNAALSRPDITLVSANPIYRAAAAMSSYQSLPEGREGGREIGLKPLRNFLNRCLTLHALQIHREPSEPTVSSLPDPPVAKIQMEYDGTAVIIYVRAPGSPPCRLGKASRCPVCTDRSFRSSNGDFDSRVKVLNCQSPSSTAVKQGGPAWLHWRAPTRLSTKTASSAHWPLMQAATGWKCRSHQNQC